MPKNFKANPYEFQCTGSIEPKTSFRTVLKRNTIQGLIERAILYQEISRLHSQKAIAHREWFVRNSPPKKLGLSEQYLEIFRDNHTFFEHERVMLGAFEYAAKMYARAARCCQGLESGPITVAPQLADFLSV